jgi:hypothetical protein
MAISCVSWHRGFKACVLMSRPNLANSRTEPRGSLSCVLTQRSLCCLAACVLSINQSMLHLCIGSAEVLRSLFSGNQMHQAKG